MPSPHSSENEDGDLEDTVKSDDDGSYVEYRRKRAKLDASKAELDRANAELEAWIAKELRRHAAASAKICRHTRRTKGQSLRKYNSSKKRPSNTLLHHNGDQRVKVEDDLVSVSPIKMESRVGPDHIIANEVTTSRTTEPAGSNFPADIPRPLWETQLNTHFAGPPPQQPFLSLVPNSYLSPQGHFVCPHLSLGMAGSGSRNGNQDLICDLCQQQVDRFYLQYGTSNDSFSFPLGPYDY
ncbi:uncharacterized protein HMPREF1541_08612 [Cyphellophora europaea CBS 101466]|uniref:Uncharacterized protein n=1 Tax=Cyphellophora europaea (strain CBS 101466) TaxID=1220924 RepID=W2RJ22_CYPE1|nr:uncharacterized protein HMPREF1541_08612 [Cyphellophora europaea CBS 101466]ETN36335.1 hypothetical protein HMPREF1541_08612 [Cyphellophora europaea CBS 101466]